MTFRIMPNHFRMLDKIVPTFLQEIERIEIDIPTPTPMTELPTATVDIPEETEESKGSGEMNVDVSYDEDITEGLNDAEPLAIDTSNLQELMKPKNLGEVKRFKCKVGEVDKGTYNTRTSKGCEKECKIKYPDDTGHTCELDKEKAKDFTAVEVDTRFDLTGIASIDKPPEYSMRCIKNTCVSREIKSLQFQTNDTPCSERTDELNCLSDKSCAYVFPNKVHDSICISKRSLYKYDFYPKYATRKYAQMTTYGPSYINNCYSDDDCFKMDTNDTKTSEIDLCHKLEYCSEFEEIERKNKNHCFSVLAKLNNKSKKKEVSSAQLPPGCSMCVDKKLCNIDSIIYNYYSSSPSLCGQKGYDCFENSRMAFVNARGDVINQKLENIKDSMSTGAQIRSYGAADHKFSMGPDFKYKKSKYCSDDELENENLYCKKYTQPIAVTEQQCEDFVLQMNKKLGYNKYMYAGNFFSAGNFFNKNDSGRNFNNSLCSSGVYEQKLGIHEVTGKPMWSSGVVDKTTFYISKIQPNQTTTKRLGTSVITTKTSNNGSPDLWLSEGMCRLWAESDEESRFTNPEGFAGNFDSLPSGCVSASNDGKTVFNRASNDIACGDGYDCVKAEDEWIEEMRKECKQYATDYNLTFQENTGKEVFNGECGGSEKNAFEGNGDNPCTGDSTDCINRCYQKCKRLNDVGTFASKGFIVRKKGKPLEGRCFCEAEDSSSCSRSSGGPYHRYDYPEDKPKGCVKQGSKVWFNAYGASKTKCGKKGQGYKCIPLARIAADKSVDKQKCKEYANSMGYKWGGQPINTPSIPGCFVIHKDEVVHYNENDSNIKCGDIKGYTCIQISGEKASPIQHDYLDQNGMPASMCEPACPKNQLFEPTTRKCLNASYIEFYKGAPLVPFDTGYVNQVQCKKYGNDRGYKMYGNDMDEKECEQYARDSNKVRGRVTLTYRNTDENVDNKGDCPSWAGGNECKSNPGYMWGNCKKSCSTKGSPQGCVKRGNEVWFNKDSSKKRKCGYAGVECIDLDFALNDSSKPHGCFTTGLIGDETISFNTARGKTECSETALCVKNIGTHSDKPFSRTLARHKPKEIVVQSAESIKINKSVADQMKKAMEKGRKGRLWR